MRYLLLAALLVLPLASCSKPVKPVGGLAPPALVNIKKGQVYLDDHDWDAALACFEAALKDEPTNTTALIGRGRAYAGKGNFDQAIADYSAVPNDDLNSGQAHRYRCLAYAELEDTPKAEMDAEIAKKRELGGVNPDQELAAVYARKGAKYQADEEHAKARDCYEVALRHDPKCSDYHRQAAVVYASLSDWSQAIQHYEEAVKLGELTVQVNLALATAYLQRARYFKSQQNTEQAQADFKQAIRLNPKFQIYRPEFPEITAPGPRAQTGAAGTRG